MERQPGRTPDYLLYRGQFVVTIAGDEPLLNPGIGSSMARRDGRSMAGMLKKIWPRSPSATSCHELPDWKISWFQTIASSGAAGSPIAVDVTGGWKDHTARGYLPPSS